MDLSASVARASGGVGSSAFVSGGSRALHASRTLCFVSSTEASKLCRPLLLLLPGIVRLASTVFRPPVASEQRSEARMPARCSSS
jgi:hypothetical protein